MGTSPFFSGARGPGLPIALLCIAGLAVVPRHSHASAGLGEHLMRKGVGGSGELAGSTGAIPTAPWPCGEVKRGAATGSISAIGRLGAAGVMPGGVSLFSTLAWVRARSKLSLELGSLPAAPRRLSSMGSGTGRIPVGQSSPQPGVAVLPWPCRSKSRVTSSIQGG